MDIPPQQLFSILQLFDRQFFQFIFGVHQQQQNVFLLNCPITNYAHPAALRESRTPE